MQSFSHGLQPSMSRAFTRSSCAMASLLLSSASALSLLTSTGPGLNAVFTRAPTPCCITLPSLVACNQGPRFPGTLPGPEVPVESHLPGPLACGEKCFKIGPAALCTSHTTELLSLLAVALVGSPAARGVSKSGLRRFVTSRTTGLVLTVPSHYD